MKTTIYELLGMIKNNNAPKKILFDNQIWNYRARTDMEGTILFEEYINEETDEDLFDEYLILDILSNEVEILETTITLDGKEINLDELKSSFNCPAGEKGESVFDKIEKLIVPNPRKWLNNATLLDVKIEIRGIEMKINEIIDRLNKEN